MFQCFVVTLLKWMKYKNRLTFAYYSIRFWDFKSLQGVRKTWKVLKVKNISFKKMFTCRNTVYYDFKSRFLVIFSSNYQHRLVLEIPIPDHIFLKISKYRTENLHFPSTGKHYALPYFMKHSLMCISLYLIWFHEIHIKLVKRKSPRTTKRKNEFKREPSVQFVTDKLHIF